MALLASLLSNKEKSPPLRTTTDCVKRLTASPIDEHGSADNPHNDFPWQKYPLAEAATSA